LTLFALLSIFGLLDKGHERTKSGLKKSFFLFSKPEIENCRFEELYDYFKRVDSSVKDSILLALPKNLPKESIQESRIPRLVPPLLGSQGPIPTKVDYFIVFSLVLKGILTSLRSLKRSFGSI
jgi:hypothetical protein